MKKILLVFTVLCVCFSTLLGQRERAPKKLTLAEAIETALVRNITILQAENSIDAAKASVLASYGGYMPTLSYQGGWNRTQIDQAATTTQIIGGQTFTRPPQFSVTNNFSSSVNLNYQVFDGFSREAQVSRASANKSAAEHTAKRTRQTIAFQVESAYLNVLRTEQLVRVSEENLKRGRRQLERIVESNRLGALSVADVYRQQSVTASDELNLITAQNNYNKAKADLVALIGLDPREEYEFSDPTVSGDVEEAQIEADRQRYGSYEELLRRALNSRPDYFSSRESYNAAGASVSQARRGYFPSLSASAGYSLSNAELKKISDSKRMFWGINLQWTLFDGFQTNNAIQSAATQERNAELSLAQAERNISVEVKKALLDLEAARKQYEVAQKGLVSAIQDRRTAEERYNVGAGTLLDLLTANAGLVNAEANKVNAVYNYIIARRNVEYMLGERLY
jgi:outer membrane protein